MDANLGDYLKTRRALCAPEDAGLHSYGIRRVKGLRREEIATLAGLSVDYYARLEQGRETNPSPQVLDSLARVLSLNEDGRTHLYRLAGQSPSPFTFSTRRRVHPELLQLMDSWPDHPALVINPTMDVLARNQLADALFGGFAFSENLVRRVFLDPDARQFYPEWDLVAITAVANLRLGAGYNPRDARLNELLAELTQGSITFRELWDRQDVRGKTFESKHFNHPDVGDLALTYHAFEVRGVPGQQLLIYHAEPGSSSEQALRLLGTLAASRPFSRAHH